MFSTSRYFHFFNLKTSRAAIAVMCENVPVDVCFVGILVRDVWNFFTISASSKNELPLGCSKWTLKNGCRLDITLCNALIAGKFLRSHWCYKLGLFMAWLE